MFHMVTDTGSLTDHFVNCQCSFSTQVFYTMAFEDLLEIVRGVGRYQVIHVLLLSFPILFTASHNLLQNFVAAVPDHRCRLGLGLGHKLNVTWEPLVGDLVTLFVPVDQQGRADKCRLYTEPQWHLLWSNGTWGNGSGAETQPCTDGWEYDRSQFSNTIVTEWDLVCGQKALKRIAQSIYMAGLLIGAIVLGRLSDKYGRRALLLWSSLQVAAVGTCCMFSSSIALFYFWRFLSGMAISGVIANTYIFAAELIPTRVRTGVITALNYGYVCGQLMLAGMAFLIRDWRWLQFAVSVPYFVIFLYIWWLSESPRWLIMNKKAEVALKHLRRMARINGRQAEGQNLTTEIIKAKMEDELSDTRDSHSILDLFRTPGMCRITCCSMVVWFSVSFSYYGLSIDLQGFGVDIYLIQVIFGAVDIPAKFIGYILMSYIGRRFTQSSSLIMAGCIIVTNIFLPQEMQTIQMLLVAVGKGCLAAAFSCAFQHTAELFPTVVRLTGMGLACSMARVGAIVAPIVRMIGDYVPFLPMAIYGGMAIVAGLAACCLPETRNMPLPDTIAEVERRAKKLKKSEKEEIILQETLVKPSV
ncbi:solute carrier family 22 member 6-A-like [Leucoraja erinacea]|uniref:solute carrier family 22 member 6-A-like n=1 Tax=Leucoraja erinaceus TaxID=7782 RepID=UPI002453A365|nr:solute carrier family 22 member 6-A-like [Leucoraja erinacea]